MFVLLSTLKVLVGSQGLQLRGARARRQFTSELSVSTLNSKHVLLFHPTSNSSLKGILSENRGLSIFERECAEELEK